MPRNKYYLDHGSHDDGTDGRCAMEWVAYIAGQEHTDSPHGVAGEVGSFCIELNDAFDNRTRQCLRPYLARTLGTEGDKLEYVRAYAAIDHIVRVITPLYLDTDFKDHAATLRALPEITEDIDFDFRNGDAWRTPYLQALSEIYRDISMYNFACPTPYIKRFRECVNGLHSWEAINTLRQAAEGSCMLVDSVSDVASIVPLSSTARERLIKQTNTAALQLLDKLLPTEIIQMPVVDTWQELVTV